MDKWKEKRKERKEIISIAWLWERKEKGDEMEGKSFLDNKFFFLINYYNSITHFLLLLFFFFFWGWFFIYLLLLLSPLLTSMHIMVMFYKYYNASIIIFRLVLTFITIVFFFFCSLTIYKVLGNSKLCFYFDKWDFKFHSKFMKYPKKLFYFFYKTKQKLLKYVKYTYTRKCG